MSGEVHRYANRTTYRLKEAHERKMHGPRFRGEPGQWWGSQWLSPLPLVEDGLRRLPETRPDEDAITHVWGCGCTVCARPNALRLKRLALRRRTRDVIEGDVQVGAEPVLEPRQGVALDREVDQTDRGR